MNISELEDIFKGKTVFITGHTGFIGSWLSFYLIKLGAKVVGYSLDIPSQPSMFEVLHLDEKINHIVGDVNDQKSLFDSISKSAPSFVFHLAAQPLVRLSYEKPLETIQTNVIGTANLLDSIRKVSSVKVCIVFSSDKCYQNKEIDYAYKEEDQLGGHDPYSASKAAVELITTSFRNSFFNSKKSENHVTSISTIRAGNIIGGGDWGLDRIVPDSIRSLSLGNPIKIRNPDAIRPFQYILDPLNGIILLAKKMWENPTKYGEAWNFGPTTPQKTSVMDLVTKIINKRGNGKWLKEITNEKINPHEAKTLMLDSTKAQQLLGWKTIYSIDDAVSETISWYHSYYERKDMKEFTLQQILNYFSKANT